jgi:hypothetical protein
MFIRQVEAGPRGANALRSELVAKLRSSSARAYEA